MIQKLQTTERTESVIVQVAPDFENDKIKQMECFGWSLQSRQQMEEKGDIKPSLIGSGVYMKVSRYTKLHFVRSLDLSNLDKIRELENEYSGLPEPSFPRLFPGGFILFLLFWYPFWPFYYFFSYRKKKVVANAELEKLLQKRQKILSTAATLLK